MTAGAHVDTFVRDHLPPREEWPEFCSPCPSCSIPSGSTRRRVARRARRAGLGRAARDRHAAAPIDLRRAARRSEPHRERAGRRASGSSPATACCCAAFNNDVLAACWLAAVKAGCRRGDDDAALARQGAGRRGQRRAGDPCDLRSPLERRAAGTRCRRARRSPRSCSRTTNGRAGWRRSRAAAGDFRERRNGVRRRLHDRVHLRDDRPAEGDDALPSRRAGSLRHVSAVVVPPYTGRHLRRDAAAGVHLRSRRRALVPVACRRVDRAVGEAVTGGTPRCGRRAGRDGAVTAPTSYRAMAPAGRSQANFARCAPASRRARRCRWRRARVGERVGRADHRRDRLDRDAAYLHRRCGRRDPPGLRPASRYPATSRASSTTTARRCRRATSDGSR